MTSFFELITRNFNIINLSRANNFNKFLGNLLLVTFFGDINSDILKLLNQLELLTRYFSQSKNRHFSHVNKSRVLKNLNLRKKADRNFRDKFLKNHFRHLNLYSNLPSWLAKSCCHMGSFWKRNDWSSHFWECQLLRFRYGEVHRQTRLKSTKTGISS